MGYYLDLEYCEVQIPRKLFPKLVKGINKYRKKHGSNNNPASILPITGTDEEIKTEFSDNSFDIELLADRLVVNGTTGEWKMGDWVTDFWQFIAPSVKSGSYLEVEGEDHVKWRWYFVCGKFLEFHPSIVWELESVYRIKGAV